MKVLIPLQRAFLGTSGPSYYVGRRSVKGGPDIFCNGEGSPGVSVSSGGISWRSGEKEILVTSYITTTRK
jgi:hypothetical protein